MIRTRPLPDGVAVTVDTLGRALEQHPVVRFAYLFGRAAAGRLTPLSDIDVAVFLDDEVDPLEARLAAIGAVTAHLHSDEVDVVVLNSAPTSLVGRVLLTRKVILDRDPPLRHRFESLALRQFFDFRFLEHTHLALRFGHG